MAECSYARCVQQRRNIRRELQRWTKNMVHIVGLERIAEELMGRRKWKLYQESMSRSYLQPLNNNVKTPRTNQEDYHHHHSNHLQHHIRHEEESEDRRGASDEEVEKRTISIAESDEGGGGGGGTTPTTNHHHHKTEKENFEDGQDEKDWKPATKCYFCVDGKLDSSDHSAHGGVLSPRHSDSDSSDSHSDSDLPPSLTPNLLNNNNNNTNNNNHLHHRNNHRHVQPAAPANMTAMESVAALAAAFSGGSSPGTTAPHLPFMVPDLHNWYLANLTRSIQAKRFEAVDNGPASGGAGGGGGGEQPLDLSKGSGSNAPELPRMPNNVRLPTLDTKHIFNSDFRAKPRMSAVAGRRTYTEDELQAALRDIQSGKLGTRRAAVIYGIPRSTLRNKVYKLALERERESHLNTSAPPLKLDEEEPMDDDKELSGAEEEKEVEKELQRPLCDLLHFTHTDIPPDMLKLILQKSKDDATAPDSSDFRLYLQNLLAARSQPPDPLDHFKHDQFRPNNGDVDLPRPSPSNSVGKTNHTKSESDMETEEASANVILKIPSFRPTAASSKNGCDAFNTIKTGVNGPLASPPVSETGSPPVAKPAICMKDVIAHSISQKFQQTVEPRRPPSLLEIEVKRAAYTPPLTALKSQEMARAYPPGLKHQPAGGKGTRPKRGKYRNYDRDSLVEAVRAVQRGEMSVHRAGSYYGVPHSTLEYKVKERHLMRPRKRDPKPNPVDEKIASLKQNDIRISQENKLKAAAMKPPGKFAPTSPNGLKMPLFEQGLQALPGYNQPPPFPFWHPGFHPLQMEYGRGAGFPSNPDFFASQMIQKLQEESARGMGGPNQPPMAKSARQMAEALLNDSNNGSFLDGIIRSSLESGVPGIEGKVKEEKMLGVEKMSNKALLEQLCRNRPLSKPNTSETNSSEDESYKQGSSPINFTTGASNSKDGNQTDSSPSRYERDPADFHTIELSNDSNDFDGKGKVKKESFSPPPPASTPQPGRIYLKKDLANSDNFQPEMLVMRYRDSLPDTDRNGDGLMGSASDNDAPQD